MDQIIWIIVGALYVITGVALMLRLDNSRRHYALLDRLTLTESLFTALAWPVALPVLCWRPRDGQ